MATDTHKGIRVLIVDDSAFMRKVLETILVTDENVHVVGHAKDGREAVRLAESLKPDVITMDINMPVMDGLQATAEIMTTNPRPIVVVSSESRQGAASTLRALELGAIEFVAKPSSGIDLDMHSVREDLLRKVRVAAKVRVVRTASRTGFRNKKVGRRALPSLPPINTRAASSTVHDQRFPVVVLAASTGGPATVMRLAPGFTRDFPAAVILVQHMPAAFTTQYAAQLAEFTTFASRKPRTMNRSRPERFIFAPADNILRVMPTGRIQLDGSSGRINGYLPNIDITMESVAEFAGSLSYRRGAHRHGQRRSRRSLRH